MSWRRRESRTEAKGDDASPVQEFPSRHWNRAVPAARIRLVAAHFPVEPIGNLITRDLWNTHLDPTTKVVA